MKGIVLGCAVLAGCVWFWKEVKKTSVRSVSGKLTPEGRARMDKINAILNTRATDSQKLAKLINLGIATEQAIYQIETYNRVPIDKKMKLPRDPTATMSDCVYPESTESEREAIRKYNRQMSAERREHNRWEKDKIEGTGRYHLLTKV